ncbi:MAG: sigma-54-dependent Fis family transcriptional regulator, partial [Candidatus Dadabacteria bacterium]
MKVLIVDDDTQMQMALQAALKVDSYITFTAENGEEALKLLEQEEFDIIISDQRMPGISGQELLAIIKERGINVPFIMITAYGTISDAVEAMQLGADDFLTKPFNANDLRNVIERVLQKHKEEKSSNKNSYKRLRRPVITNDPLMIRVLEVAEAVAKSDATVLIQGESGTGKELVARLIHCCSDRAEESFIAVNCAALPSNLLESELFGHEKGAFTGAINKKLGKFELAHGGTILLDEISEMELSLQAKLLRVLQEREVDRVGGKSPIPVNVRVIATTNRDLEEMVKKGKFRADLFYRINVIPLTLPPLRERRADIRLLVKHFLKVYAKGKNINVDEKVWHILESYPWPGNVRELENAVQRAAILCRGEVVKEEHFLLGAQKGLAGQIEKSIEIKKEAASLSGHSTNIIEGLSIRPGMTVSELERKLILETLKATDNNRTKAASLLGISIRTLR